MLGLSKLKKSSNSTQAASIASPSIAMPAEESLDKDILQNSSTNTPANVNNVLDTNYKNGLRFWRYPFAVLALVIFAVVIASFLNSNPRQSQNIDSSSLNAELNKVPSDVALSQALHINFDTILKNTKDSTTAFLIQDASGQDLLSADTVNKQVQINGSLIAGEGLLFGDGSRLDTQGLRINNVLVCDVTGCIPSPAAIGNIDLSNLNASNLTSGIIPDSRLSGFVTMQGNQFNGPNQLIKLDASGQLPPGLVNGSFAGLNANQTFTGINTFSNNSNSFTGNGAGLTNINAVTLNGQLAGFYTNASNISSGTLNDTRLSTNVTTRGNTFNGANQLVLLDGSGNLPALNASALTNLNASNISSGTVADARLSVNVTVQGNTFNGANQLVQLNGSSQLPAVSGVNLTSLNASNLASGTVADARLSNNVTLQGNSFNGASQLVQLTAAGLLPALDGSNLTNVDAATLSGLTAGNFVQLAQGVQTDASTTNPSIGINKTGGTADILQLQRAASNVLRIDNSGYTYLTPSSLIANNSVGFSQTYTIANATASGSQVGQYISIDNSSNTVAASNSAGLYIQHSDNGTVGNRNTGINISLSGSNTSQTQVGLDSAVARGAGAISISTGTAGTSYLCAGTSTTMAVGICSGAIVSAGTSATGTYSRTTGASSGTIDDSAGTGVYGAATAAANAGQFVTGVKGITSSEGGTNAYTSTGVFGQASGNANATTYGGYFTFESASAATNGAALYASNNSSTAKIFQLQDGTTDVMSVSDGGTVNFKNQTNSATAFVVQNATAADTLFAVDTTARSASGGNLIKIGNSTGTDGATTILVVDHATSDPTTNLSALNGGLFYNSTTNKLSIIENGTVKVLCNQTDASCGGNSTTLQQAYDASTGGTTPEIVLGATRTTLDVQDRSTSNGGTLGSNLLAVRATAANDTTLGSALFTVNGTGQTLFQNSSDSITAFQIQNSTGSTLLGVDTANTQLSLTRSIFTGNLLPTTAAATSTAATTTTKVADANNVGLTTSIAIGADGLPIISYRDATAGDLAITKCTNISCSTSSTTKISDANDIGTYTSIAIGADGLPIVSHLDSTAGDLAITKCTNISCSTSSTTKISDANSVGWATSIAIGADGLPIVSHYDATTGDLAITKCGNAACSSGNTTTKISDANDVGSWTSIAIGADGLPIVATRDIDLSDLAIIKCGNAACSSGNTTTKISDANDVGMHPSIAVGADGLPIISSRDATAGDLAIIKCGNAACSSGNTTTKISDANVAGQYTSIAIGADGLPIVSHLDSTIWDLAITKCGNAACSSGNTTTKISDVSQIGEYTSIAIGTDGLPIIAHRDLTGTDLAITKCGNGDCSGSSEVLSGGISLGSEGAGFQSAYIGSIRTSDAVNPFTIATNGITRLSIDGSGISTMTGSFVLQATRSLIAGETNFSQTLTNGSATGGTIQGYSQNITVANTSSASTTNGINIALTDNASALANTNTGLKVALSGTNTSQIQYGIDASASRGIGIRSTSSGGATVTCGGTSVTATIGICAGATGSGTKYGIYANADISSAGAVGYFNATNSCISCSTILARNTIQGNILELQGGTNATTVFEVNDWGLITINPTNDSGSPNLVASQSHVNQSFTNASSTGSHTVTGYNQAITVSSTNSGTTKGFNVSMTDNATQANTNVAFSATLQGSNTSQTQYAVDVSATRGVGVRGAASGTGTLVDCGGFLGSYSIGVCGTSSSTTSGYGGYFKVTGSSAGAALYASNGTTASNIFQLQDNTTDVLIVANGGLITLQPAASLTAGQTHMAQILTNASSTGGTVNGYNQTITVNNTVSASTTNGINISITDNTSLVANVTRGITVNLDGTNTGGQIGVNTTVNRGLGVKGKSDGYSSNSSGVSCLGVTTISVGVCGEGTTTGSWGVAGSTVGGFETSINNNWSPSSGGAFTSTAAGTAGSIYYGAVGESWQSNAAAYTSIGVYGRSQAGAGATTYAGYFTLNGSSASLGSAIYASNDATSSNILQLQDNTTDVMTVADGGVVTFKNAGSDSATAFQIQDASSNSILVVDATNSHLKIYANTASPTKYIDIYYDDATDTGYFGVSTGTAVLGTGTGSVSMTAGAGAGFTITGNAASTITTTSGGLTLQGAISVLPNADPGTDIFSVSNSTYARTIANFKDNTTSVFSLADGGAALFKNATDSSTAFQIQQAGAGATLFTADTSGLIIKVAGNTTTFGTLHLENARVKSTQTTAPTIGTPTSCATTPSAAVTAGSTDSAGSFTITSGTGAQTSTCQVVITFNKAYGSAPKAIILTPGTNVNSGTTTRSAAVTATTTTTFTVVMSGSSTVASTTYTWYYWVIE